MATAEHENSLFLESTVTNELHASLETDSSAVLNPDVDEENPALPQTAPRSSNPKQPPKPPTDKPRRRNKPGRIVKKKVPMKTCLVAILLMAAGVVLFALAVDFYVDNPDHAGALPLLILAFLVLLPGTYASINLIGVIRGWRGFRLDNLPAYDVL